ncbi:N-acetylglucosamine-6-phosphate deacetylase [Aeoliella mucimassa]|uniref:N-acetylglucosamine-6-phosphate deacetylase n=1 Tax=Aeoliella mucimassa TaxID=2527972 RepID=A0A518ALX7_9BACT|nr:N-acetylglucosamine-6-phosphate deacetylase [Aeoliella mucimassa]QDU55729.1 N-acetylglucosamine-6-phosphate deacetylase [Aeoliella mucimassa]
MAIDQTTSNQDTIDNGAIDLQVNGFAGVDFNSDSITIDDIHQAFESLRACGVAKILATIITDRFERMKSRARLLVQAMHRSEVVAQVLAGVHFEGPFISPVPGYVGAHPAESVLTATADKALQLVDCCEGHLRLVTLAPEQDAAAAATQALVDSGVVVSAGHCNPSADQLDRAIDAGLSMFTHLGNGCPLELSRHANVIQLALSRAEQLYLCFIADGVHVPFFALKNYLRAAGVERSIVVSDAISAAGCGPGRYSLAGQPVVVDANGATWCEDRSHLVGSAMTMSQACANLRDALGYDESTIRQLTRDNALAAVPAILS